ncbi:MAG: DUF5069 domain-containing protein [Luteolibacter sp.]|uniref:DUF5069 domain-containing protein n=1 Tax=Luteolibacter sp. TaxID=1962973 RepID=UPI003262D2F0
MSTVKDLSKVAPTSPRVRTGGYAILARMADKGRADLAGTVGDFHFDCPLDNFLFGFKDVKGEDVKKLLEGGSTNEEIADWLDENGTPKSEDEKKAWSDTVEAARPYDNPEKKDWFVGVCAEAGCDPATSTLFDYLEADDKVSFAS